MFFLYHGTYSCRSYCTTVCTSKEQQAAPPALLCHALRSSTPPRGCSRQVRAEVQLDQKSAWHNICGVCARVMRMAYGGSERPLISSDSMHESTHTTATRHAPRIAPMVALARGLGAACRISVARLRPAESDVRGRSSTWSRTFGAVRQVRGGAEAGFWVVCWVAASG